MLLVENIAGAVYRVLVKSVHIEVYVDSCVYNSCRSDS